MASKTVVELFDDLDGGRADETVRFALDGVEYEIDLSAKHAASLRDTLAVYIGHAHRPAGRARRTAAAAVDDGRTKNGRNGSGKVSSSASLTAEIRRLASESAQKVTQAARAAEAASAKQAVLALDGADDPVRRPPGEATAPATTPGPVPALVIPFMEAGL
ncbi:MAG TPA: Lsr2 family protein [Pseudonocardiaceae bacterium]|nr:Lsr2 family protein [Pseudonocardiaceae bacterium]